MVLRSGYIDSLALQRRPQTQSGRIQADPVLMQVRHDSIGCLVAQCSATPATVAATPPCSATPFQTQISVRHLPAQGGGGCETKIFRGCSATPVLHLQNAVKSRKSAATRVARHVWRDRGYPQSCATKRTTGGCGVAMTRVQLPRRTSLAPLSSPYPYP